MANEGTPGRSWLPEAVCILFLAFAVFLLVTNILPTRSHLAALTRETNRVGREIEQLRSERDRLDLKARALTTDPYAVEKELREGQRITRPDEKIIRMEEEDARREVEAGTYKKSR